MENIPVTLSYPKLKLEWDLSLPVDVPIFIFVPQIVKQKCGSSDSLGADWLIRIHNSRDFITSDQSLGSVGILPGEILVIQSSIGDVPDFSRSEVLLTAKAILISESKSFPVNQKFTLIGRRDQQSGNFPEIDLSSLDKDARVSRRHAQIIIDNGSYILRDLGSKNGTFVNGHKITSDTRNELITGDLIRFGNKNSDVVMKFQINI